MNYTVKQDKVYSAEIQLGFIERLASNDAIKKKLEAVGFVGVMVTGSGRTRYATGIWKKPDATAAIPKQITKIKEIT